MTTYPSLPQRDAELSRLATFASVTADRHEAVYARLAEVQLGRDDAATVGLALDVLAILDGPNPRPRDGEAHDLGDAFTVICPGCEATAPLSAAVKVWPRTAGGRWRCPDCATSEEKSSPAGADATPGLTVYRAAHDSIVMGLYTTAAEARKHCETEMRREYDETTKVSLWWREDEDTVDQPADGEAELFVHATPRGMDRGRTWRTGYVVTPLEVASKYDEEADE